jgi:Complex 1 protein (LYR family)
MYTSNRLGLSDRQIVLRMYLAALRCARDHTYGWKEKRPLQMAIRAQFDRHRHEINPERIQFLIACGQTLLNLNAHHEPYIRMAIFLSIYTHI